MDNIIITTKEDLTSLLRAVLEELEKEREGKKNIKLYSINQVSKMLGVSFSTIKKAAENGLIHTAVDGRIPGFAIEEYLRKKA